ncbi:MAG: prolyl oligopeptidase family serine peptidase [Planctomycetes bacterium]|nr:prolyl oligopeptidase family serine peptidase [Planctomycetota bacterium]
MKTSNTVSLLLAGALSGSLLTAAFAFVPPPEQTKGTAMAPVVETVQGETFTDEYRWLESLEKDSPAVRDWTTMQIDRTRAALDALPCRAAIAAQLEPLMKLPSVGTPVMAGSNVFYTERSGDQNQAVLKVRPSATGAPRELLNPNSMNEKGLLSLDWWRPSLDGKLMAYGSSLSGSEMSELRVIDVATGTTLPDVITGKVDFESWTPKGDGMIYSSLRDPKDPYSREVHFHTLGQPVANDAVLLKQTVPSDVPFSGLSRDGKWLMLGFSHGWQSNDLSVANFEAWLKSGKKDLKIVPVAIGMPAKFYPLEVRGDTMYMQTTLNASNAMVVGVDLNHPEQANWKTIIPQRNDEVLEGVSFSQKEMIGTYTKHVCSRLERFDFTGKSLGEIPLPGLGTAGISTDDEHADAYLSYTSYDEPRTIYRLENVSEPKLAVWWKPTIPVDLSKFTVERVRVSSKDGTMVPLFMVRKKSLTPNSACPTLLYGYGGFNVSLQPGFNPSIIPWIEAGGIYAVANLRGGGEYGESWHEAGMLDKKQNVFDDFYACAEWLIGNKWTDSSHLAIQGGSNGGLLTGVAVTQRPDLFVAAISAVPLLDMLRYQQFLLAKYWVPEYGSSEDAKQFKWIRAYSPYQNVKPDTKYPAVLFTAGENDSRVHPLHARKMTARMQAVTANLKDARPIYLWVDRDAGHGQGKPLANRIKESVDMWSFLMWQTGLCDSVASGNSSVAPVPAGKSKS